MEVTRKHRMVLFVLVCVLFLGFGLYNRMASRKNIYVLSEGRETQQANSINAFSDDSPGITSSDMGVDTAPGTIVVHIEGEVVVPGVYELEEGARVNDLVLMAGGLTPEADRRINLAQKLLDETFVYVPALSDNSGPEVTSDAGALPGTIVFQPAGSSASSSRVNINTADQKTLETLSGIGPVLAERIIQYREEKGPFQQPQDLKRVTGIGDKRYADIEHSITI